MKILKKIKAFLKSKKNKPPIILFFVLIFINIFLPSIINYFLKIFGYKQYPDDYIKVMFLGTSIAYFMVYFVSKGLLNSKKNQPKLTNNKNNNQK